MAYKHVFYVLLLLLMTIIVFSRHIGAQTAISAPQTLPPGAAQSADRELLNRLEARLARLESGTYFIPANPFERRINDFDKRLRSLESAGGGGGASQAAQGAKLASLEQRLAKLEEAARRPPSPAFAAGQQSSLEAGLRNLERSVSQLQRDLKALETKVRTGVR